MNYWTLDETTYKYFYVVDGEINWGQPSPGDEVQVNENLSYIVPIIEEKKSLIDLMIPLQNEINVLNYRLAVNASTTHSPSELEFYSVEAERYR